MNKKVFYWVFNDNLVTPYNQGEYTEIGEEADEILRMGWHPNYLFQDAEKNFFYLFREPHKVTSFDFLTNLKYISWENIPYTYKLKKDFIFRYTKDCEEMHIWIIAEKHLE